MAYNNPPPFINPSIEDIGLEKYLNKTVAKHDGRDYNEWEKCIRKEVNISNLARLFNVSRPTAFKWMKIYQKEQNALKPTK